MIKSLFTVAIHKSYFPGDKGCYILYSVRLKDRKSLFLKRNKLFIEDDCSTFIFNGLSPRETLEFSHRSWFIYIAGIIVASNGEVLGYLRRDTFSYVYINIFFNFIGYFSSKMKGKIALLDH